LINMAASAVFSVGLTGGIGSGKTTVANLFAERGASIIDTDQIAHQLTMPGGSAIPAIEAEFGPHFIASTGALDRARMREFIFSDPTAKQRLESILHPLIRAACEKEAKEANGAYLMFVVPLLIESGNWRSRVSRILVVDCPEQQQLVRVMDRNGFSEGQVRAIMTAQASREDRLKAADDIVVNEGDTAALMPQVERLHALYSELAHSNALSK
jgi:dephospho-CoA kinase